MAAKPREYRSLPGRGRKRQGFLSFTVTAPRTRLWLGRDHLLAVESQWYAEDYRRFYFRDIQAILMRKTGRGKIINLVLGVPAALSLIGLLLSTSNAGQFFWDIMTGVFAFFLLYNTLSGPTCVCQMQTAVQTLELPSLQRLWRARKVLRRLRPLIVAAQGQLAPEDIAARMAGSTGATAPAAAEPAAPASTAPPESAPPG